MNKLRQAAAQLGIRRGDLILAASLLLLAAVFGILAALCQPEPAFVSVRINGAETCRLPLNEDETYSVGEGNTIQISGGSVRMIHADCPDKVCVKTGAISLSGQSIVCAPNRVVITIVGSSDTDYDVRTN